ncbi:MAG: DUF4391 domain-containing protein [Clostridiales bacterium]|nr:DUF4391 domain-containing protein [Clostridiales bacterium]
MLELPKTTEFNKVIPKEKLFARAVTTEPMRDVYESQVKRIIWKNKLSSVTYPPYANSAQDLELEVFEIQTFTPKIDKRLLRSIDRSIPYYIFHVVTNDDMYQAWIAEKNRSARTIRVENYRHTGWMPETEFQFEFTGSTPKKTLDNLIEQVNTRRIHLANEQAEQCSSFMAYFREMRMTRSYKPVLILAVIQCGGMISLEKAVQYFKAFYRDRINRGLPTEKDYCVYSDENASLNKIYANLINNPINALCNSGYFAYDSITCIFSFAGDLYDNLTLNDIDEIVNICKNRLNEYFERL